GTLIRGTHDFQSCTFNRSVTSPFHTCLNRYSAARMQHSFVDHLVGLNFAAVQIKPISNYETLLKLSQRSQVFQEERTPSGALSRRCTFCSLYWSTFDYGISTNLTLHRHAPACKRRSEEHTSEL